MADSSSKVLVIDVGNTLTKIAVFDGDDSVLLEKYQQPTLDQISALVENQSATRAVVSKVGELSPKIEEFLSQRIKTLIFDSSTPLPIKNCYKTPSTLGPDRLAAAVGASALFPNRNVLVIDSGTAITYDLVTSNGHYLGGAIAPGISIRFKALNQYTAKLPLLSISDDYPLIGADTTSSILSGVLNGVVNEVDGYIDDVKAQYSALEIVFTGGDSFFFDKKLKNSIFVHPNLVLFGLNRILIYNENY